ncbi:MAG: cupin domain-containing protein [Roseiarcus sp.]|uniref:cupin domain-containing protein n=1 Tax=Roseiarcus sp. TaxID=1969460 RepID=UPI003C35B27B
MSIQRLAPVDFTTLENPGIQSVQIVWSKNAPEALVTITRVTMEPGSISARHLHPNSEQIWIVERGHATLLMDEDQTDDMQAGDVVRTPAGSIHCVNNTGHEPFVYLAVTTPPQDFTRAYRGRRSSN